MLNEQKISLVSGYYAGSLYTGNDANPQTCTAIEKQMQELSLSEGEALFLLKRSRLNELELLMEPNPIAFVNALKTCGLEMHGVMVFVGDEFEYFGTCKPYVYRAKKESTVLAGIAVHVRDTVNQSDLYRFIEAEHISAANDWFIQHALGGIQPALNLLRAMSLGVAIRNTVKWLMPQFIDRDFSRYQSLVDFHIASTKTDSEGECENPRKFRRVKSNAVSVTEQILGEQIQEPLIIFKKSEIAQISDDNFFDL